MLKHDSTTHRPKTESEKSGSPHRRTLVGHEKAQASREAVEAESERSQVARAAFPSRLVASIALPSRVGEGNVETGRERGLVKGEKVVNAAPVLSLESMNYIKSAASNSSFHRTAKGQTSAEQIFIYASKEHPHPTNYQQQVLIPLTNSSSIRKDIARDYVRGSKTWHENARYGTEEIEPKGSCELAGQI
ncbi:hypothetical protein ACO22_05226 [Paracoccidioides brasiliensis]|uniref:Uncharacterized protein n=1 Tax=Paracoccidioides brasiliensis TaxID=121759 RepID=A0A1D2JAU8_PARBR|nr:hypothetical protein ACO22_05226 [Paracoccidioides brasiliensis]